MIPTFQVTIRAEDGQEISCKVASSETIMSAFDKHGYVLQASCKSGGCGVCVAKVLSGNFEYLLPMSANKLKDVVKGGVFLCRAAPQSNLTVQAPKKWSVKKISMFSDVLRDI
jgi:ferredoxin